MSNKAAGKTPKRTEGPDADHDAVMSEAWDGMEDFSPEAPEGPRFTEITRALRDMPDHAPPVALMGSIMARIKPARRSLSSRFWEWARQPFSVTLTPLKLVPAACVLLLLLGLTALNTFRGQPAPPGFTEQVAGIPVMLSLKMPDARTVSVIGSFNDWRPQLCQKISGDSEALEWTLVLTLPPGRYEYAYIIDGNAVIPDPWNETVQEDGFGNRNSVLYVGNGHDGSI